MPAPTSPNPAATPTLADFACLYLYGVTNHPYQQSTDIEKFGQLYDLVIGAHGGVSIGSSFHPYQLVNPAGVTVWYAAYAQLYAQRDRAELFGAMAAEQARFLVTPPASFSAFHVWPDTRLTSAENPVFSHYIPFVLPFLVRKGPDPLRWDAEFAAASSDATRLQPYLEAVAQALHFVQPAPAFVLGFEEFREAQPEQLIEQFMACQPMLLR